MLFVCCAFFVFIIRSAVPCKVMEGMTGRLVKWDNVIEVELAKRKRTWLSVFGQPKQLLSEVTELHNDSAFNYITEEEEEGRRRSQLRAMCCSCMRMGSHARICQP